MLELDAESLYAELCHGVRALLADGTRPGAALVGIWSGGAWLAERLHADLGLPVSHGVISSTLHRDDFGSRGLAAGTDPTQLPFAIDGSHIVLIDDVLYTGRTIRAVINELFDFGRPASVTTRRPRSIDSSPALSVGGGGLAAAAAIASTRRNSALTRATNSPTEKGLVR